MRGGDGMVKQRSVMQLLEEGPRMEECRQSPDAGKDEEMGSPLEPLERMQPCPHLDFQTDLGFLTSRTVRG